MRFPLEAYFATGKNRRQPSGLTGERGVPDAIHPPMNPMEPAGLQPPQDAVLVDLRAKQLFSRNDTVLPSSNFSDPRIGNGVFLSHIESKSPAAANSPPARPEMFAATGRERYFGGSEAAKSAPASTQAARSSSASVPTGST